GNLASILAHCQRGDEVIVGDKAHTFLYEAGGISALGGIHSHQLPNQPDGTIKLEHLQAAIRPEDIHQPPTRLIALENTHNRCGGVALSAEYCRQVGEFAKEHGLLTHLDGARIFNAAVALGVPAKELAAPFDSVTFCLSKALCAPVGSLICGSHEFIERARRVRKQLGGGMRQAGVLAAAGIVALETMVDRLAEDHARAKRLAQKLQGAPGLVIEEGSPATNMIFAQLESRSAITTQRVCEALRERGVLVGAIEPHRFRIVVHYWIDDAAVEQAAQAFWEVLEELQRKEGYLA
ncbi:MAG: GntG family PLP-dependent aldolase, partial [Anaerolineales bacterium]|nr:aminotransferase class I/II-fold pyridoxal phosphate-dependent enzyme [Anaerolineales bacterium]MDW8446277.1 GntG family PLP-dependent aldolase [Anaerolineales bacterium]